MTHDGDVTTHDGDIMTVWRGSDDTVGRKGGGKDGRNKGKDKIGNERNGIKKGQQRTNEGRGQARKERAMGEIEGGMGRGVGIMGARGDIYIYIK